MESNVHIDAETRRFNVGVISSAEGMGAAGIYSLFEEVLNHLIVFLIINHGACDRASVFL